MVAAAVVVLVAGLLFAVASLTRTLESARRTLDDVRRVGVPLLEDLHAAVRHAEVDLSKVDNLLERADSISGTVDTASRLAFGLVSNPAVKSMALASGAAKAFGRLRRFRRRG
jgi:uncharacterized protein YoxC